MNARLALTLAGICMFVAVAAGAFGAHLLRTRLEPEMASVWQTAVTYQAWHALALLGLACLLDHRPGRRGLAIAGWLFLTGIVLFSGSLYALALTGMRIFGAVTPLGGAAFLGGWGFLVCSAWKR
ncbi:MAG: DUF423 domain-containing protein [Betaproteobacteria bacterium]